MQSDSPRGGRVREFKILRMKWIIRMLRYLFWLIVVWWTAALLRRIVGKMIRGGSESKPYVDGPGNAVTQKLVRDPVCGMHLAEGLSVSLQRGGEVLHFCSPECREKYLSGTQNLSASA